MTKRKFFPTTLISLNDSTILYMKYELNPELYDMGIRVVNMKETAFRSFALNMIFTLNSILP